MKKKIKFFAMALAALAIVSCSKEDVDNNGQPPVVEGVETYATFSFSIEGSGAQGAQSKANNAKSETDENRNTAPDKVNNITVTVFKEGTPSLLEAVEVFRATGIDQTLTGEPMKLTSGAKRIFVFANADGVKSFPKLDIGKTTLEDCYITTMNPVNATGGVAGLSFVELTKTDGYFMSNARTDASARVLIPNIAAATSKAAKGSETEMAALNKFTFIVQKGVSKVKAKLTAGATTIAENTTTPKATISDLKYTVKNINVGIPPVQLFANPNITETEVLNNEMLPQASSYTAFKSTSDDAMKDIATFAVLYSNLNPIDQELKEADNTNAVFVTENTNARQVYGNTSYLAVRGKYLPSAVLASCKYDATLNQGQFTDQIAGTLSATGDFWRIDLSDLKLVSTEAAYKLNNDLFQDEAGAKALLTLVLAANAINPTTTKTKYDEEVAKRIIKYAGGLAYYRLNIGVTIGTGAAAKTTYGIRRNSIYDITIAKINRLGANSEDRLNDNPETPVSSSETFVTAVIKVTLWVTRTQSGEL